MIARSVKDQPEIMLAVDYHDAERVEEYWNGTLPESGEEPHVASRSWNQE